MTNLIENCTENDICITEIASGINQKNTPSNEEILNGNDFKTSYTGINLYYLIQVEGDSQFQLTAKSARKNGVKAELLPEGWVYQNKKDADEILIRWSNGKRILRVVPWYDARLDDVWCGSKDEARLAKKLIRHEIDAYRLNKKKLEIELQCNACGLHYSWLYAKTMPKELTEKEKRAYTHFKPLWDKTFETKKDIDLRADDIAREVEDIKEISNPLVNFDNVINSLMRNERGDSELFLSILKNKYLFDSTEGKSGEFYFWTGTHWKTDREKRRYRDIEAVSNIYEKASIEIRKNDEKKDLADLLAKRAFALRSSKRCKSVFEFVATEVYLNGDWDYCPGKLPCLNGIVDLKTGQIIKHKPELLLRSICPTSYNFEAKRPLFDKFLDDITLSNPELKSFLGRVLGSALIGTSKEEKIFILYGKDGRNGKGTLMQTLEKVLGPLAKTFPAEMLLLQRNPPSSSTPRPEKANLQGVRFAIFSEIDEKRQIDASEVKNLSGGDTITCRRLFSNVDIQIKPSHTMFIQTNFKPKASSKDGALWKRTVLIPFNAEFVEEPKESHERKKDEGFKEKLLHEREGILSWLIEGCLEYQKIGLAIPEIVKEETANYRKENDGIERFLSEMCTEAIEFSTPKNKMIDSIKEFCKENRCESPTRNEITKYLRVKFSEFHTDKGNFWRGVKIVDDREIQE